jgi:protein SCO1/2
VAVGLALAGAGVAYTHRPPPPVLGALPEFALTGHDNQPVSLGTLRGRPFVADFIFTTCAGFCPAMTSRLAQLQKRLPAGVTIVSFSVDPEHDTPEVLARYAQDFGAGPTWRFATGRREALYSLATEGFRLAALEIPKEQQQPGTDGPFLHSSKFVLVDGAGRIRGYYDSEDSRALERLVADAARCKGAS